MDRRREMITAEKIDMDLLTQAAFDIRTALTYTVLAGLRQSFISAVFARGPQMFVNTSPHSQIQPIVARHYCHSLRLHS